MTASSVGHVPVGTRPPCVLVLLGFRAAMHERTHGQGRCYFSSSTGDMLPSPCFQTSLTSPLPGANHDSRVPLPNGNLFSVRLETTASAWKVPAGTFTVST